MSLNLTASQVEDLSKMKDWLDSRDGLVAVICGKNGDMDTIASGICLAVISEKIITCGVHKTKLAKRLTEKFEAPFKKLAEGNSSWPQGISGIVSVDAAGPSQLGVEIPNGVPILSIDHHDTTEWKSSTENLHINWDVRATTQIIFSFLSTYYPESLSSQVRKLLLAGLITDTARFKHADIGAFQSAVSILEDKSLDYAEFVQEVESGDRLTSSDRGAILKALNNSKSTTSGDWNLVYTTAGTLEGRVASTLLNVGCDVSLVSRYRQGVTRLTARATRRATIEGVHLGRIMEKISEKLGGNGGGHDGAAGFSNECDLIRAESAFIAELAKIRRGEIDDS